MKYKQHKYSSKLIEKKKLGDHMLDAPPKTKEKYNNK